MTELRLYVFQRVTAALMLPLILAHLFMIFYATQNGLTAAEILGRTRGSVGWAVFYGLFVVLAAVHGGIGVRSVLREWTGLSRTMIDALAGMFTLVLMVLGARAVYAVVMA